MPQNTTRFFKAAIIILCFTTTCIFADPGGGTGTQVDTDGKGPFTFNLNYQGDTFQGLVGGLTDDGPYYIGLLELELEFDLEKYLQLEGMTGVLSTQGLHGRQPNQYVNSLQGIDSNEQEFVRDQFYLYEAWVQKDWHDKYSLLAGFYNLNSEFYVTDSSPIFILPAFQMGLDLAQTNINGAPWHIATNPTIRFKYTPSTQRYLLAAVVDATNSTPGNPIVNAENEEIATEPMDAGYLGIMEIGHLFLNPFDPTGNAIGKLAFGAWGYTKKAPTAVNQDVTAYNAGTYVMLDYPIYVDRDHPNRIAHWFTRYGIASPSVNELSQALSTGLAFNSFISQRPDDTVAVGFAPAWTSTDARIEDPDLPHAEYQTAITYVMAATDWLDIQGEIQYIHFQGGDQSTYRNTLNVVTRFTVKL